MQAVEVPKTSREFNKEVAAMVAEIGRIGPKVPEIARRLGRHKETVRYWYKKLEENEFAIQAIPNHEALGLQRVVLEVQFGAMYKDYVQAMMYAMNDLCYVVNCAKSLMDDTYVIQASVPTELLGDYLGFIEALKEQGVFTSVESFKFDWFRNKPMEGELYDFETGHWEFDVPSLMKGERVYDEPRATVKTKFDKVDLLLLKELQKDATREMQEIQQSLSEHDGVDINYKTLCWHLKQHVEGKGLLKGFRINWMGTRWDPVADKARHRSHKNIAVSLLVRNPAREESLGILRTMDRLPTLWSEASGEDYFAELSIPTEMLMETLQLFNRLMRSIRSTSSFHIIDQRNSIAFTFPYKLFDEGAMKWTFNKEELLVKFKALEAEIQNA